MCWVCDSVAPQCPHCDEARYHDALLSIGLVPSFSTTLPRTGIETNVLQQTQEQKKPDNQEPLQAAPAAVPESAPKRIVIFREGMCRAFVKTLPQSRYLTLSEPKCDARVRTAGSTLQAKEARAPDKHWFPRHGEATNHAEVLFLAFAACVNAHGRVGDLKKWASSAVAATASGELPKSPEWRMAGKTPGEMLKPLDDIYVARSWSDDELENISVSMQAWHSAGRTDSLTVGNLRYNISARPEGLKPHASKKKEGPPRWRLAPTIAAVATMIKQHGRELRKLLALEMPREEVPSMAE